MKACHDVQDHQYSDISSSLLQCTASVMFILTIFSISLPVSASFNASFKSLKLTAAI